MYIGEVVRAKEVFEPIHQSVSINQKTVVYRPTDKLVLTVGGILSGAQNPSEINTELRPDTVLLKSFGYSGCADQSVIQQTLDAASETPAAKLEDALSRIWSSHSPTSVCGVSAGEVLCVDIDIYPPFLPLRVETR